VRTLRSIAKRALLGNTVNSGATPPQAEPILSWAVRQALAVSAADLVEPAESEALAEALRSSESSSPPMSFEDLFYMDGVPLPCWEETHLTLYGDWLTAANNYPVYYSIFRKVTSSRASTRMLELGVFTGYSGTVFARAAVGKAFYLGIDPNQYLTYGLQLASRTFKTLRLRLEDFDFALIDGASTDIAVQSSILLSGPFDIVHIDGDHTLTGKLVDLELARQVLSKGGVILVDDYDHHSCVAEAIQRAMSMGWFSEFAYIPKMRGLAALRP